MKLLCICIEVNSMDYSYSIKELSQLTRIKPHTLRIWEQRYGIMKPERSQTNIRRYNDEDLKYLLNVSVLYDNGFKISHIAKLSQTELSNEVRKLSQQNLNQASQIQSLVIAMLELDEDRFEQQINAYIISNGLEVAMKTLVFPFLQQVGTLWMTNTINPAQEHFITNLIRKKLFVAIDGICNTPPLSSKKFILFLPEGELHEISLLFCYFMLKSRGHKVIYLGQSLPLPDLGVVQQMQQADFVITIITSNPTGEDVEPYLKKMKTQVGNAQVWLSGFQVLCQPIAFPEGFQLMRNPDEMQALLADFA